MIQDTINPSLIDLFWVPKRPTWCLEALRGTPSSGSIYSDSSYPYPFSVTQTPFGSSDTDVKILLAFDQVDYLVFILLRSPELFSIARMLTLQNIVDIHSLIITSFCIWIRFGLTL